MPKRLSSHLSLNTLLTGITALLISVLGYMGKSALDDIRTVKTNQEKQAVHDSIFRYQYQEHTNENKHACIKIDTLEAHDKDKEKRLTRLEWKTGIKTHQQ